MLNLCPGDRRIRIRPGWEIEAANRFVRPSLVETAHYQNTDGILPAVNLTPTVT